MNIRVPPSVFKAAEPLPIDALRTAAAKARAQRQLPTEVLAEMLGIGEREAVSRLALSLGWSEIDSTGMAGREPDFDRVPLAEAMLRHAVLLREPGGGGKAIAVLADPLDADAQTWVVTRAGEPVLFHLALRADIDAFLTRHEEAVRAIDAQLAGAGEQESPTRSEENLSFASISAESHPVVRLVSSTLYDALKAGASDVHLESTTGGLQIKYRIDGVLDAVGAVNGVQTAQQVISRLKVLAELDIAERRIPQDGSFRVSTGDRDIDLRLSIMPSVFGEDAVVRILDKRSMLQTQSVLTLDALGLHTEAKQRLRVLSRQPYGMLLVTGPTGSGKTTTLYAALSERNNGREKIVTIEDPVEYQLAGVLQIPVHEKKGLTFAKGLRSILRHDPDIIMVGEIRDEETAEIAVQSALTGHLVFSTVHANSVYDVFSRFSHMGLDPYAFASALNGVWAQRLVRINCARCAVSRPLSVDERDQLELTRQEIDESAVRAGRGCGDCRGTGYKGRRAISEMLVLDDEIRELIVNKAPVRALKELARQKGTRSLREAALARMLAGETSVDEVLRVTLNG